MGEIIKSKIVLQTRIRKSMPWITAALAAGLPRNADKTFDLDAVHQWIAEHPDFALPKSGNETLWPQDRSTRLDRGAVPAMVDENTPAANLSPIERQRLAVAGLRELDLAQRRGELLQRAEVERLFVSRCVELKRGLMALPRRAAPMVIGVSVLEAQTILEAEVRKLLETYSRRDDPMLEDVNEQSPVAM